MIFDNPVLLSASSILFLDVSYKSCQEHLNRDVIIDSLLSLITSLFFLLEPLESSTPGSFPFAMNMNEVNQSIPKYKVSTDGFHTKWINEEQNGEFAMDMNEQIVQ